MWHCRHGNIRDYLGAQGVQYIPGWAGTHCHAGEGVQCIPGRATLPESGQNTLIMLMAWVGHIAGKGLKI